MVAYIFSANNVTLSVDGVPITVDKSHMNFDAVKKALLAGNFDEAVRLATVKAYLNEVAKGAVEVTDDGVYYRGIKLTNHLADVMVRLRKEGHSISRFVLFMEKLLQNPSATSINELYLFLEAANLPITEDGCFLAYKAVRPDYRDKHTGKIDNSIGAAIPPLARNQVDDNRERTCSFGYHAAAYEYARGFMSPGDHLMVVKVHPEHVVSVPSDYSNQKLRCTWYEVVGEAEGAADHLTGKVYVGPADEFEVDEPSSDDINLDSERYEYDVNYADGYDDGYEDGYDAAPKPTSTEDVEEAFDAAEAAFWDTYYSNRK